MAKKRRFDFTKKNKRSGKVENVGYLDLEQDEEQSRCSLYFYGDIVSPFLRLSGAKMIFLLIFIIGCV